MKDSYELMLGNLKRKAVPEREIDELASELQTDPKRPSDAEERLRCAHHGDSRLGYDPKMAQVVGHVTHVHGHWDIAPSGALWFTGCDAVSVLKKGLGFMF